MKNNLITESHEIEARGPALMADQSTDEMARKVHKMEILGTLASGIAHDFNNILSPIMIHAEMAMMRQSDEKAVHRSLEEILKATERARDLIQQILFFSHGEDSKASFARVGPILKEVLKLIKSATPSTIAITQSIETDNDKVSAKPDNIYQVLMFFCCNAVKSMKEIGGTLLVKICNGDIESGHMPDSPDEGHVSYVKIIIKDTGAGLDKEAMRIIGSSSQDDFRMSGFGLNAALSMIKECKGHVNVETEQGLGTTVTILLPVMDGKTVFSEKKRDYLPRGNERVLLIDDEQPAIEAMKPMLEMFGYQVTAFTSSAEALETFRNNPQKFDLVITDMTMPNMTGKELAEAMFVIRPDIPVILCTGSNEQIDEEKASRIGINAFVMKPIIMHEIANKIREVLD